MTINESISVIREPTFGKWETEPIIRRHPCPVDTSRRAWSDLSTLSFLGESQYPAIRPGVDYVSWKTRQHAYSHVRPLRMSELDRLDRSLFASAPITLVVYIYSRISRQLASYRLKRNTNSKESICQRFFSLLYSIYLNIARDPERIQLTVRTRQWRVDPRSRATLISCPLCSCKKCRKKEDKKEKNRPSF